MDIYFSFSLFFSLLSTYFLFAPFLLLYYLCVMGSSFHRSMWLQTCAMQSLAGATISTERHYQVRSAKQRPGCCENLSLAKFSTHDMLFFVVFWTDCFNDCISTVAGFTTISGASLQAAGRGRQLETCISYHNISYHIISSLCTVQFCKRKQNGGACLNPGSPGRMSYFAPRCAGWKLQAWKRRSPKTMWYMHPLCQPLVRLPLPGVKNRLKQMKHISLGKLKGILGGIRLNKGTMCEMERDSLLLIQFYYPKIRWQFPQSNCSSASGPRPRRSRACTKLNLWWSRCQFETFQVIQWYLVLHCTDEAFVGAWLPWPRKIFIRMRGWHGLASQTLIFVCLICLICLICHAMPCAAHEVLSALTTPYLRIPLLLHFLAADRLHALKQTWLRCTRVTRAWDLTSQNWF